MRKIAVFSQKGGVGKTTTVVNLGAGLSRNGRRVIIIDLDPQSQISVCHNVTAQKSLSDVINGEAELEESISKMGKNLDIIHCEPKIANVEENIKDSEKGTDILERCFTPKLDYDYVILDCPPSLRMLNECALFYSKEVIVPCSTDFLGYDALLKTISSTLNFNLEYKHNVLISAIIPTMFDKRRKSCRDTLDKIKKEFTPLLVAEPIRENSKLNDAPQSKKSIFNYAKSSTGAEDYWRLVKLMLENENMYDTRFSMEQRQKAMYEYYKQGKKRELMVVGNKITFGYKFFTGEGEIIKEHLASKARRVKSG